MRSTSLVFRWSPRAREAKEDLLGDTKALGKPLLEPPQLLGERYIPKVSRTHASTSCVPGR